MGRYWYCLFLLCVPAAFGRNESLNGAVDPTNVTVTPSAHSLEVRWQSLPDDLSGLLESYRVRVWTHDASHKRVHWVPEGPGEPRELVACLEPGTAYNVQVFTRFLKSSNLSDGNSEVVPVSTLPETQPDFLGQVWEHKVYVLIGAVLMFVLVLLFLPCLCYCYARKRRSLPLCNHDKTDDSKSKKKTSKGTSLPSATELQRREKLPADAETEDRYCTDPVVGLGYRTRPSASRQGTLTQRPPPSYSHTLSIPAEPAPAPPDVAGPESDLDNDDDDYQNDVFRPGPGMELYANQAFLPSPTPPEDNIYGNVRY